MTLPCPKLIAEAEKIEFDHFMFAVASGSGTSASIRALNNTSASGHGKITFTVNTSCGSFQVQRQMWVGVPLYDDTILLAQPNYSPICANESTYFNAFYNSAISGNTESTITHYE